MRRRRPLANTETGFAWSPDGSRVAFVADRFERNLQELFLVTIDDGVPGPVNTVNRQLIGNAEIDDFTWSPDSRYLVYRGEGTVEADPGCRFPADDDETDECIPGVPLRDHTGGTVVGDTADGTLLLAAPFGCDEFQNTDTMLGAEHAYRFANPYTLSRVFISTDGSNLDTVLYARLGPCHERGPLSQCSDDTDDTDSELVLLDVPPGDIFVVVDAKAPLDPLDPTAGEYVLSIAGEIAGGTFCDPADPSFACAPGFLCIGGTCAATACNDGIDNGDAEDTAADSDDPGCTSIVDDDETDPGTPPACANSIDDDGDGQVDYPADVGCARAGDDSELEDCVMIEDFEDGVWPPVSGWDFGGSSPDGQVLAAGAREGSFGLVDTNRKWRNTEVVVGDIGDIVSVWVRPRSNLIHLCGVATSSDCVSASLSVAGGALEIKSDYGGVDHASAPYPFETDTWYRLEFEFLGGTSVRARAFDELGAMLVEVQHTFDQPLEPAGPGIFITGQQGDFDALALCAAP